MSSNKLLLRPTTEDFRYIDKHMTLSVSLHRDEMQWGILGLNIRKSPGRKGIAAPSVGKQK